MKYIVKPKIGESSVKFSKIEGKDFFEYNGTYGIQYGINVLHEGEEKTINGLSEKAKGKLRNAFEETNDVEIAQEQCGKYVQYVFYTNVRSIGISETKSGDDNENWGLTDDELEAEVERLVDEGFEGNSVYEELEKKYGNKSKLMSPDEIMEHLISFKKKQEQYENTVITDIPVEDGIFMTCAESLALKNAEICEKIGLKITNYSF